MSHQSRNRAAARGGAFGAPLGCSISHVYGAFELKQIYQRNMMFGMGLAALLHIALIGGLLLYQHIKERANAAEPVAVVRIETYSDIALPPSMTAAKPQVNVAEPEIAPPSVGIPTPVPDEEAVEDVRFATRAELAELSAPVVAAGGLGGGDSVEIDSRAMEEEFFPKAGEFVAVDELPVLITRQDPVYPEIAILTRVEGVVTIELLIDRDGNVRDARILRPSGSNVGFEQAALDAALKYKYRPAIQNGRPVAVRISHRIELRLQYR